MTQRPTSKSSRRRARRNPQQPLTPAPSRSRLPILAAIAALVVVVGVLAFAALASGAVRPSPGSAGAGPTTMAQWPADPPGLRDRLTSHGLAVLTAEGTVLHIHQHIDVFVHGTPVTIPADIGVDSANGILSPVHTHDASGVIHVESPTVRDFTLGDFFDVWGVQLTSQCLGDFCASGSDQLAVFLDGQRLTGDPRAVVLRPHQEIAVAFGSPAELSNLIPSSYSFAPGL